MSHPIIIIKMENNEGANSPGKFGQQSHLEMVQPLRLPGDQLEPQISNTAQIIAGDQPKANFASHM